MGRNDSKWEGETMTDSILADIIDPCFLVFTPSCNPLLVFRPSHLHLMNGISLLRLGYKNSNF